MIRLLHRIQFNSKLLQPCRSLWTVPRDYTIPDSALTTDLSQNNKYNQVIKRLYDDKIQNHNIFYFLCESADFYSGFGHKERHLQKIEKVNYEDHVFDTLLYNFKRVNQYINWHDKDDYANKYFGKYLEYYAYNQKHDIKMPYVVFRNKLESRINNLMMNEYSLDNTHKTIPLYYEDFVLKVLTSDFTNNKMKVNPNKYWTDIVKNLINKNIPCKIPIEVVRMLNDKDVPISPCEHDNKNRELIMDDLLTASCLLEKDHLYVYLTMLNMEENK